MTSGRRTGPASALALALALSACAGAEGAGGAGRSPGPPGGGDDVPLIGLSRGGHWSVITVRPPHLSGPHFHLQLRNSVLTGAISGGNAPAGTLRVNIDEQGAQGFGPLGPVALEYAVDEASTVADGTWNGGRVHLVFTQGSLNGTVVANSAFHGKSHAAGSAGGEAFRQPRLRGRAADLIEPLPRDVSCEYFLDSVTPEGALHGGSICAGMPQATRLEVPAVARAWMSHSELVTVLIAVLSSPPIAINEDFPRPR